MKEFQREDYVYVRLVEDYKDKKNGIQYKKGELFRYRKDWLIEEIAGRQFGYTFDYANQLIYEKKEDCDENDILYNKVYQSIMVANDRRCRLCVWPGDYFYLNDWLFEHLDEKGIQAITNAVSTIIPDKENSNKLIEMKEGYPNKSIDITVYFKAGERLDFNNPAVMALFYDMDWMKFFAKTEVISGEEKEKLFEEDFSNAIYAQAPGTATLWKDNPNYDLQEYHYFKLKEGIKVKTKEELKKLVGGHLFYDLNFIADENGYIEYVSYSTSGSNSSSRDIEQMILNFADRISKEEALKSHKKAIEDYIREREIESAKWRQGQKEEELQLQKLYEKKKNDPLCFPGVNGYFTHNSKENSKVENEIYSLEQIKEFYQKLGTLDPRIVQEMCFYGGTVPYILNNADESRTFGDIDIFVPVPWMEKLREELQKQDSFEMIYDSKPLAQSCHLTSRIEKESTELVDENKKNAEFLGLILDVVNTPQENIVDVDESGNVYNPLEAFLEKNRSYYNKIQDFGFKAKLFGIKISVFPIYQYKKDIMAKSFNVNEMHKFLLGVRVLNNTDIQGFARNVKFYDSVFKVLPLEYTLVSKRSAVDNRYSYRLEKDREDVEYILSHSEELGIENQRLEEIQENYPDYSISIAYRVTDNGTTTTMGGESYKELVLERGRLIS